MKGTQLAFRTPRGGLEIPAGGTTFLTQDLYRGIPVWAYSTIRVVCVNRTASSSSVTFNFIINQGGELVASLDEIVLLPGNSATKVFTAPGVGLSIEAVAEAGAAPDVVDVLVYGFDPFTDGEDPSGCQRRRG